MEKKELLDSITKSLDFLGKMDQTIEVRGAVSKGTTFLSFVKSIDEKMFKSEEKKEVKKETKKDNK